MRTGAVLVVSSVLLVLAGGVALVTLSDAPVPVEPAQAPEEASSRPTESPADGTPELVVPESGGDEGLPDEPKSGADVGRPLPADVRPDLPREVEGRVVDEATGASVAGAEVLYRVVSPDRRDRAGNVVRTGPDGTFAGLALPTGVDLDDAEVEVWARSSEHAVTRRRPETAPMRIALRTREAPQAPGRVVGEVTSRDGRPFVGRLLVELRDEFGVQEAQFAVADPAGRFELDGVPAGVWNVGVSGAEEATWLHVPADASVPVRLVAAEGAAVVGPASLPVATRELVVRGVPDTASARAVVVVRSRPRWRFRRRVRSGEVRFPEVPLGRWSVGVVDDGRVLVERDVLVERGSEPLTVELETTE